MRFWMFVLVCIALVFMFGSKDQSKKKNSHRPIGEIVEIEKGLSLVIKMKDGEKIIADYISGYAGWQVGDIVLVYDMDLIIDVVSKKRTRVLIGAYSPPSGYLFSFSD